MNSQSGNIFAILFAAVALVGVLAAVSMQMITGPIYTATRATQKNMIETHLLTNARLVVMNASTLPSAGDFDADGFIEPAQYVPNGIGGCVIALTGGGCLPSTIGGSLTDPYGSPYGYCVWDHGEVDQGHADGNPSPPYRLRGSTNPAHPVIALISAGANRTFETTCSGFDGVGNDGPVKPVGSDDFLFTFTYAEATAVAGGLWSLKSGAPDTAEIAKHLEIKDSGGNVTVAVDRATGIGDFLGITTDLIAAKTGGSIHVDGSLLLEGGLRLGFDLVCGPADTGLMQWSTLYARAQTCDGSRWQDIGDILSLSENFVDVRQALPSVTHQSNTVVFTSLLSDYQASVDGGGSLIINGINVGSSGTVNSGDTIAIIGQSAPGAGATKVFSLRIASMTRTWIIVNRNLSPATLTISPTSRTDMFVDGPPPSPGDTLFGDVVIFTVTNTGDDPTAHLQNASLTNLNNFQFATHGAHGGDGCSGRVLAPLESCSIEVRSFATNNGTFTGQLRVSDGTTTATATVTGEGRNFSCTIGNMIPGCIMPDGTIYIGISEDSDTFSVKTLFAAPTSSTQIWGSSGVIRRLLSTDMGIGNTAALAAYGDSITSGHPAAKYCNDLVTNGHSDWYMPSSLESMLVRSALGINVASSTEVDALNARRSNTATATTTLAKAGAYAVRCVRRGYSGTASCSATPSTPFLQHGESVKRYEKSAAGYGEMCAPEGRVCLNGELSGSYEHSNCSIMQCNEGNLIKGCVRADGTIFAGLSPVTGGKMFLTPSGVAVRGWGSPDINRATSLMDGKENTNLLAPFGNTLYGGHPAAFFCDNYVGYGRSDWYLPSRNELLEIQSSGNGVTRQIAANFALSSSQTSAANAARLDMRPGIAVSNVSKATETQIFCIRTE